MERLRFGIHSLLWLQYMGTECIEDYWCAVHTVQNHVIDTLNLLYVLRLDTKAFQII